MTLALLKQHFSAETLAQAEQLLIQGRVSLDGRSADGDHLFGRVQDRRIYQLMVPRPEISPLDLGGQCSCPKGEHCIHVCALLMKYLQEIPEYPAAPAVQPTSLLQRLVFRLMPSADCCRVLIECQLLDTHGQVRKTLPLTEGQYPDLKISQSDRHYLDRLHQRNFCLAQRDVSLLWALVENVQCRVADDPRLIQLGASRELHCQWHSDAEGTQHLRWFTDQADELFLFPDPWYLDTRQGDCGPTHISMPETLKTYLMSLDGISPESAVACQTRIRQLAGGTEIPLPHGYPLKSLEAAPPQPRLDIEQRDTQICCQLRFDYAGVLLAPYDPPRLLRDERVLIIPRQQELEQQWLAQFQAIIPTADNLTGIAFLKQSQWLGTTGAALVALVQKGWQLHYASDFQSRLIAPDAWYGEFVKEETGGYALSLGIRLGKQRINLIPQIQTWLQQEPSLAWPSRLRQMTDREQLLLPRGDEQILLSHARLRPLLGLLFELHTNSVDDQGRLPLSRCRAAALGYALGVDANDHWEWREPTTLAGLRHEFRHLDPAPALNDLRLRLHPYQQRGLAWLTFLQHHQLGGILADDNGLGRKTQVLAHLAQGKAEGWLSSPALLVAPKPLLADWQAQAEIAIPGLHLAQTTDENSASADLLLTTYEKLAKDQPFSVKKRWSLLILDQAEQIKNPASRAASAVRALSAERRLCLTGIPLDNHLGACWGLFEFLMPGFLGPPNLFRTRMRDPIERQQDQEAKTRLTQLVHPFLLRRSKTQVAQELPAQIEIHCHIQLDTESQQHHDERLRALRQAYADRDLGAQEQVRFQSQLQALRQQCAGPAKLERIELLLTPLVQQGRRILLYSHLESLLEALPESLQHLNIGHVSLIQKTPHRELLIRRFRAAQVPLMICDDANLADSLVLSGADTLIQADPSWGNEILVPRLAIPLGKATNGPKFHYRLICQQSIESRLAALTQRHPRGYSPWDRTVLDELLALD